MDLEVPSYPPARKARLRALPGPGFTLVELLVVIAIIAVLAGILLPVLARAKDKALSISCLSSLRQWGVAAQLYATDNRDTIPRDGTDNSGQYSVTTGLMTGPGTPNDRYAWFNALPPLMGKKSFSNYWDGVTADFSAHFPFPGGKGKIWECPAAKANSGDAFFRGGAFGFFSYAMNLDLKLLSSLKNGVQGNIYPYPQMPKLSDLQHPEATVLLTEAAFSPTRATYTPDPSRNGVLPAVRSSRFPMRHSGKGGNLVFTDGHAQYYSRAYITGSNAIVEKPNPDVIWNPHRNLR